MEIVVGKYAGFCPGVKRAWELVLQAVKEESVPIFILGELIHNPQAIKKLGEWGIKTVEKIEEIPPRKAVVFIRAHGEPPQTFQKLGQRKGLRVIDATCPSVARVQKLAKELEQEGYLVVVCGEKDHPEAQATVGYVQKGIIVDSVQEAAKVPSGEKIGIVSQTTFSPGIFQQICQVLKKKTRNFKSLGTICNFTQLAQKEARKIAKKVDLVIVIGGKQSSNTKRLVEVAQEFVLTYHIETAAEIKKDWYGRKQKIGLLAGASTPSWLIQETKNACNLID